MADTEKPPGNRAYTLKQIVMRDEHDNPIVTDMLRQRPTLLEDVTAALDKMGFRRFRFLGAGMCAVALETTENQIVRLNYFGNFQGNDIREKRPKHPAILQPI